MSDAEIPTIEVFGVYRLDVTDDLVREQTEILQPHAIGTAREEEELQNFREQLESTVLIEVIVRGRDNRFDVGHFGQDYCHQVAWAEAYLTLDGESLAVDRGDDCPDSEPIRVAFFIHYWAPEYPTLSSYGPLECPAPEPMPERLRRLVPYELLD